MIRFFRKPLLLVYVFALVFGWTAILHMKKDLTSNQTEYEKISQTTVIRGEVIPNGGELEPDRLYLMASKGTIHAIYTEAFTEAARLHIPNHPGPIQDPLLQVYASNRMDRFLETHQLIVKDPQEIGEKEEFLYLNPTLADQYHLHAGDTVSLYLPTGNSLVQNKYLDPEISLKVAGILDFSQSDLSEDSVIVGNQTFFRNPSFLHAPNLHNLWGRYQKYEFAIKPEYNNDFQNVEKELKEVLGDSYILHTTAREFYNVLQPLKDKMQMQTQIYWAVLILLVGITSFLCILLVKRERMEILIRLIFGETKHKIYCTEFVQFAALFLGIQVVLYGGFFLTLDCPLWLPGVFLAVNLLTVAVNLALIAYKGILTLYQNWEG